jgi:hypothetical protein
MTMRNGSPPDSSWNWMRRLTASRAPIRVSILRLVSSAALGVAVALLVSCGSSGTGLIPVENAGPLQSDFETVAQAAENASGSCVATEAAILKTERDFGALPSAVDGGLRNRLQEGIAKLHSDALVLCKQPPSQATATDTSPKTTTSTRTTTTTPTVTQTTSTPTTPTNAPTTSGPGGGTPAPGAGGELPPGAGSEQGAGNGAGEGPPHGDGGGPGGAGQEAGK